MQRIYLDYAAATPLDPDVVAAMEPYLAEAFGNPSSIHEEGRTARAAVEQAREEIAGYIGARSGELIFTNGVTEATNLAILGAVKALNHSGSHIVSVATEHRAVLAALEGTGCEVTFVPVDQLGRISAEAVLAAIRPETILVSVMHGNNEIGTIAPLAEIGKGIAALRRKSGNAYPFLHTDAAQTPSFLSCHVDDLRVDLMSLSAGKMYGPKAVGALYIRAKMLIEPVLFGGGQERGLRPGTENVAGIVGFAAAFKKTVELRDQEAKRLWQLRTQLRDGLRAAAPSMIVNADHDDVLPHILNVSFPGYDGEAVTLYLDTRGIAISTASSCSARHSMSHVLFALGLSEELVRGSVRFSLGRQTTKEDIEQTIIMVRDVLAVLRPML